MTDAAVIGAFVFMLSLLALMFLVGGLVHIWHDWAEDRRREAEFAEQWRRTHHHNQDLGRYGYQTGRYHVDTEGQAD